MRRQVRNAPKSSNRWLGHKVLIAPQWITSVRWLERSVTIDLSRDAVKQSPTFESTAELNRKRESGLYQHYGRLGYWTDSRLRAPESVL
jgi:hypothetical protein